MEGRPQGPGGQFCCWLLALALATCLPQTAAADAVNNEWHSTARALGMGNTGIATAEDPATAMFYNPAALSKNKRVIFEFFAPQYEFSLSNFAFDVSDQSKMLSLPKSQELMDTKRGKTTGLGFSLYPSFNARNFAAGMLLRGQGHSVVEGDGTLRYESKYYIIPTVGFAIGLMSGLFKIGVAGRAIIATENRNVTASTTEEIAAAGYRQDPEQGFGFGVDGGFIFTLPWDWLPTFAGVARNVGGAKLTGAAPVSLAADTKRAHSGYDMTFDAAFSLAPKLGKRTVMKIAFDYRDVTDENNVDLLRRINMGIEIGIARRIFFRGGVSRGYWTAGFGFSGSKASLDLSAYGEELHPTDLRAIEDRRIAIRYGARF